MLSTERIDIVITKDGEAGAQANPAAPEDPASAPDPASPEKPSTPTAKKNSAVATAAAIVVGKQVLQAAASRVGQFTRSDVLQQRVNAGFKIAGYGVAFAVNPLVAGIALGGELIGGAIDYGFAAARERRMLEVLNARAGTVNRSR